MQTKFYKWVILLIFIGALMLPGCSSDRSKGSESSASTTSTSAQTTTSTTTKASTPANNAQFSNLPRLEGKATVVMNVKKGAITIEVDGTNAPITAGNFVDLVQRGVYNGVTFHRVEPDFVVQGGDPQSKDPKFPAQLLGTGNFVDPATQQPRFIPLEIKPQKEKTPIYSKTFKEAQISSPPELKHARGAVAMARSPFPDSASSQFYITLAAQPFLDGEYAVFGKVTQGMEVVDQIQKGDRIESAKVTQGLANLKNAGK